MEEKRERGDSYYEDTNREQKRELMSKRRKVRERGIMIEDDMTWKERKMK